MGYSTENSLRKKSKTRKQEEREQRMKIHASGLFECL